MNSQFLLVELAGPAGAGKTTIRNALPKADETIRFGPVPQIKHIRNLPFFLRNFILLLPVLFAIYRDKKQSAISFPLIVRLAILNGWSSRLNTLKLPGIRVLLLDQGPVYMLAELLRHGPANFRRTAPKWWDQVCEDWANALDMVICVDGPDPILMQRNRTREKNHGIKQNADDWARQFLAESRAAQREVLKSLAEKQGQVKFVEIDTSQFTLDELAQRIVCLLEKEKKKN